MLYDICLVMLVGVLWGATNPFIRLASQGIEKIDTGSTIRNISLELKMIGSRLNYWIPFLINQSGSVLYVWILQSCPMIVAVPVANSFAFVFTALCGCLLGEKKPNIKNIFGIMFLCLGSFLLVYDQIANKV